MGGVALLLWGLRLVRIGMTDGWGAEVRIFLGHSLSNRVSAFFAGLGVTVLLQSSSATALLAASFSGQGLLATMPALAVLLGADVGTTLVAQILTLNLSAMSPLLVAIGVALFSYSKGGRTRDIGRIMLGLGLMLLALKLIVAASAPMRESYVAQIVLSSLSSDLIFAVLVGALIAWAAHSSLATVLLIISLCSTGVVDITLAFALILGANVGGALPPIMATLGAQPEARRPPLGNLLFRVTGVVIAIPLIPVFVDHIPVLGEEPARQIANFHTAFNIALAIVFLPLVSPMAKITEAILPAAEKKDTEFKPMHLDRSAFETPPVALVNAEREALRMGEIVERMFRNAFVALKKNDKELARYTRQLDDVIDEFYDEIKLYLTKLSRESLGENESKRCSNILTFTTNLEHIGDIIAVNMIDNIVRKKVETRAKMSLQDREDINSLYQPVLENFRLSLGVFMSGDIEMARQLVARKYKFSKLERRATANHLKKLREDVTYNSELSALQLDVLRDLKRVNSHLVSVAYPILDDAGQLRSSRLRKTD